MGNHHVGSALATGAKIYWLIRGDVSPSKEEALAALDDMAEDYRGADAEFDDEYQPDTPLGRLIAIAFDWSPEDEAADEDGEQWYDGPLSKFSDRYGFC